jgi:phosphoribosylformylglycinamidine cyclo-ligase|tara:strand:- start:1480 stop:2325 length:846 start_codon:yes stop_codon:yes gene_type:complete
MVDQVKANKLAEHLGLSGYAATVNIDGSSKSILLSTDGVGTKLLLAEHFDKFDTVGIDLVAMCANDIICAGGRPHSFLDYYATGSLDLEKSKSILSGVLKGCEIARCELVGGETAQLNPMFLKPSWFDLAGFMMGVQEKKMPSPSVCAGDFIVGIPSSGLHSNGFTTIRETGVMREDFLTPTRIYVDDILNNIDCIKSCAHITGGGITGNLPRALEGLSYHLEVSLDPYWEEIKDITKLTLKEMYATFNCGWGMLIVTNTPQYLDIADKQILGQVLRANNV